MHETGTSSTIIYERQKKSLYNTVINQKSSSVLNLLIYLFQMYQSSNPWKRQKAIRFSDIFRG